MKLSVILLILNCLVMPFCKTLPCKAENDVTYYARVMDADVNLYKDPDGNLSSIIFTLPQSYFVELSASPNAEFYYARYNDIYGYVKKSQVKPVVSTPNVPFLTNITFRVFVPSGANLRATPYDLGATNLLYSVPFLDTNFLYYGTTKGEESISKKGDVWYFCKYFVNNLSYTGYIYSPLCDLLSPISQNQEDLEYLQSEPVFSAPNTDQTTTVSGMEGLSSTTQAIIIVALSLPCLLFIYLLFKPTIISENSKSKKTNKKKKISRLKHSDYYEYEDDFS